MQLNIVNQEKVGRVSKKKLQSKTDQIIKILTTKKLRNKNRLKAKELTVVFLTAFEMKKINFQFRKKNKATDVLSFPVGDPDCIGELLMCPTVLLRQAENFGHSYEQELLTMFVHGLLHLLGYDHERSKIEEKLMFSLQNAVIEKLFPGPIDTNS